MKMIKEIMWHKDELKKMVGPLAANAYFDSHQFMRDRHWSKAIESARISEFWKMILKQLDGMPEIISEMEMVNVAGSVENYLVRSDEDHDEAMKVYGAEYYRAMNMFMQV